MARLQDRAGAAAVLDQAQGLKVLVIFEGRDAAGKGGVIKRITERTQPAHRAASSRCRTPTERERTQWYFQRYVAHLPGRAARWSCSTAAGTTARASSG